jgi:hypothetical protein
MIENGPDTDGVEHEMKEPRAIAGRLQNAFHKPITPFPREFLVDKRDPKKDSKC